MSRIELKGLGDHIPTQALPDPTLGDTPTLTLTPPDGSIFRQEEYSAFGYTHYEVIVIGAAGGQGGDLSYGHGGAGGGGGLHIVEGRLTDLPDEVLIKVGKAGADGRDSNRENPHYAVSVGGLAIFFDLGVGHHPPYSNNGVPIAPYYAIEDGWSPGKVAHNYIYKPNPAYVSPLDGQDGGYSAFGAVAKASGGKGGKISWQNNDYTGVTEPRSLYNTVREGYGANGLWMSDVSPGGDGGDGGIGGRTAAGGGGTGGRGIRGTYVPPSGGKGYYITPSIKNPPKDGGWDGVIGAGGGGGLGGTFYYHEFHYEYAVP